MKKSTILLFVLICFTSCSKIDGIERAITKAAGSEFNLTINNAGEAIYRLEQNNDIGFVSAEKIKNAIDKYLNVLPNHKEEKVISSYSQKICDRYDWETPKIKVHLYYRIQR